MVWGREMLGSPDHVARTCEVYQELFAEKVVAKSKCVVVIKQEMKIPSSQYIVTEH